MSHSPFSTSRRLTGFSLLIAGVLTTFLFGGCQGGHPPAGPEIHGDLGVRVQSKDTSRISPER